MYQRHSEPYLALKYWTLRFGGFWFLVLRFDSERDGGSGADASDIPESGRSPK